MDDSDDADNVSTSSILSFDRSRYMAPELIFPEDDDEPESDPSVFASTASDVFAFSCLCLEV